MSGQFNHEETTSMIEGPFEDQSSLKDKKIKEFTPNMPNVRTCINTLICTSIPSILYCFTSFLLWTINFYFVSKTGNSTLIEAIGLGNTWLNISTMAVIVALNSGTNVFISQAYGAKNRPLIITYFYKALILRLLNVLPCLIFILSSYHFFILCGVEETIAEQAFVYCISSIGLVIATAFQDTLKSYILGQNIFTPVLIIQLIVSTTHFFWCKLFIADLSLGVKGVAFALTCSQILTATLMLAYIAFNSQLSEGFFSPTKECTKGLLTHVKNEAFVGAFCYLEWTARELCTLMAGSFLQYEIASLVITNNMMNMMYMIPIGVNVCLTIYAGKSFGENNAFIAKLFMKAAIILDVTLILIEITIMFNIQVPLIQFYDSRPEVLAETIKLFAIYLVVFPADFLQGTMTAILKGAGLEKAGSRIYLFSYYVVALPLAFVLGLVLKFHGPGIWIGLGAGIYSMLILSSTMVYRTDFKKQAAMIYSKMNERPNETPSNFNTFSSEADTSL